jgi:uncharacterized membrane protein
MPNLFSLINSSWDFYRSQPVLNQVLWWLFALPLTVLVVLAQIREEHPYFKEINANGIDWGVTDVRMLLGFTVLELVLTLVLIWGLACVLVVGKRLLTSRAGRSRTSFRAVTREGGQYVLSLFLTGFLRNCFTFFWGLLLIVPGVIYFIRTFFYHVVIVSENLNYRAALQRSKEVTKGKGWETFFYLLGLNVIIILPAIIATIAIYKVADFFPAEAIYVAHLLCSLVLAAMIVLFTLSTVSLYGALKKAD